MKSSVLIFWHARQPRERRLLLCVGILLLAVMTKFGLSAAQDFQRREALSLQRAQTQLDLMRQQEPLVKNGLKKQKRQHEWLQAVRDLAAAHQLNIDITESSAQHAVVQPTVIAFPALLRWLTQLENDWRIRASKLELRAHPDGVELLRLELRHGE